LNSKIDYRSVLKNRTETDEIFYQPIICREERMTTPERKLMERVSALARPKEKVKPVDNRVVPKFIKQLEPFSTKEGSDIELSVEFTSTPASEVFWYKDGLQMESSIDFHIESTANKSLLRIREGFKSDSGTYQVKLFNELGVAQSKAYLTIIPAHLEDLTPKILLNLTNLTVNSGDPVKFQTQAKGDPAPILTWFKDDERLEITSRVKEFVEEGVHTLLIMEATASDSGCYECVAENDHGKSYTRAYLNVMGDKAGEAAPIEVRADGAKPLSSKYVQPALEVALVDQTVKEGSQVKFECVITHSLHADHAHVYWHKGDKLIKQSKYFNMQSNQTTHSLSILEAFPEDEGVYKCTVKNPAGQVSTSAFLKIEQTAQIPEFIKTINDTEVESDAPTEFSAEIKPNPLTNIEWSRDGVVIKENPNHHMEINPNGLVTLHIKETKVKDGGTYSCRAYNSAGSVNCTANLIVKSMLNNETTNEIINEIVKEPSNPTNEKKEEIVLNELVEEPSNNEIIEQVINEIVNETKDETKPPVPSAAVEVSE